MPLPLGLPLNNFRIYLVHKFSFIPYKNVYWYLSFIKHMIVLEFIELPLRYSVPFVGLPLPPKCYRLIYLCTLFMKKTFTILFLIRFFSLKIIS